MVPRFTTRSRTRPGVRRAGTSNPYSRAARRTTGTPRCAAGTVSARREEFSQVPATTAMPARARVRLTIDADLSLGLRRERRRCAGAHDDVLIERIQLRPAQHSPAIIRGEVLRELRGER